MCSPGLSWSLYSSTGHLDTSELNHLSTLHSVDQSILFVVCQNRALRTEAFFPEPLLLLLVQAVLRDDVIEVHSCLMHFLYYQRLLITALWTLSHWEYLSAPKGVTCFWLRQGKSLTISGNQRGYTLDFTPIPWLQPVPWLNSGWERFSEAM